MKNYILNSRNLYIIFSITLLAVMGVSSVTPAFPKIIEEFGINTQEVGLLITVFTLPGIVLTPVFGILADRLGRKKILVPAIFLFGLASGACGLARDYEILLVFRFLQGVGAASLGSLNVTLIGDIFSGRDRTAAMGYNASVLSVGTASYPAIGGGLAMIGWNYPFFLPVVAVPLGLWVLFCLRNPEPSSGQSLRIYLANTFRSVRSREVLGLFLLNVFTFIILYGSILTYIPVLLGDSFQAESYMIGIVLSVSSVSTAFTSSRLGRLSDRYAKKQILIFAIFLYCLALLMIPMIPSLWLMMIPSVIFGTAMGLNNPTLQTLLVGCAPTQHRAAFMAINGMVLRLGQTLGPLVTGAVYSLWGTQGAFLCGAFVAVLMGVILLTMVKAGV